MSNGVLENSLRDGEVPDQEKSPLGKHPNSQNPLFDPIDLQLCADGSNQPAITLSHRIVLAPPTRYRSTKKEYVPRSRLVAEYYAQRACEPGTLLISEATIIAPSAGGNDYAPGIWNEEQVQAWKEVRFPICNLSHLLDLT